MNGGKISLTFGPAPNPKRTDREDAALDAALTDNLPAPDLTHQAPVESSLPTFDNIDPPDETYHSPNRAGRLAMPIVVAGAALGWTVWFVAAHFAALSSGDSTLLTGLVGLWAAPVMLLAVLWLIVQRSSRREADRFADVAQVLSAESARLEARLTVINQELSLAREFIAEQSRDLESAGRMAVERLSEHGDRLQSLVHDNHAKVEAIGNVSASALENMERLRGQLPVMTSAAKDVTNNIGNAGRTAQVQVHELIAGFNRLNEFGQASERQVITLRARIDEALEEFERRSAALDASAQARTALLSEGSEEFQARLLDHQAAAHARLEERRVGLVEEFAATRETLDQAEAEGLTSLRARLGALRDEAGAVSRSLRDTEASALANWRSALADTESALGGVHHKLSATEQDAHAAAQARIDAMAHEAEALEARLREHASRFDSEIAQRREDVEAAAQATHARLASLLQTVDAEWQQRHAAQSEHFAALTASAERLRAQLRTAEDRIAMVARAGHESEQAATARVDRLAASIEQARALLATTDGAIEHLTDNSVRLLEIIQAGARHSSEDLVVAIDKGEARLSGIEARARALHDAVSGAHRQGEELSNYVLATHERLGATASAMSALHDGLESRADAYGATLEGLHASLAALDGAAGQAAGRAQTELAQAIATLETALRGAIAQIEQYGAGAVESVAARLGEESHAAIERALRIHIAEVGGRLEQAAAHASGISREATVQLRDQLTKVDELVGNLEARVSQARTRAEEQVDNDFARRAALITESLNSNSIDIAKALDTDVSDSSWSSYLRGDRGIFTRRAVRLLENGEAKSVSQIYENDRDFREHVSHYIHDFEAMLRQLLSTRDGHALGVTLLSSDMGKLYVALAQAIERLRS